MESNRTSFVTFKKTSCYFCSEWLSDDNIKDHLSTCGKGLETCSNGCKAFVQRKDMEEHLSHCPKRAKPSESPPSNNGDIENASVRLSLLEENMVHLRKQFNEEIVMRHQVVSDIGTLKKRNQLAEEWTRKANNIISTLQFNIDDEANTRKLDCRSIREAIDELSNQLDGIHEFKDNLAETLNSLDKKITENCNTEAISSQISSIETDIKKLRFQSSDDVNDCVKYIATVNNKFGKFEEMQEQQQQNYSSNFAQLHNKIENSEQQVKLLSEKVASLTGTLSKTNYNVKQVMNITHEMEDKSEKFEKILSERGSLISPRPKSIMEFPELDDNSIINQNAVQLVNTRGHLMWRIEDYTIRKIDAKENGTMLSSPLFSNKPYGYVLRLDVFVNGIGTWRNRNIIICLTVCNGAFDTLLPWPCTLNADIILRDQPKEMSEAKNIFKSIVTKKRNVQIENHNQYIHIPHSIIEAPNSTYIRNDAIILEVRVYKEGNRP